MTMTKVLAYALAFVLCVATIEAGSVVKRRSPGFFENEIGESVGSTDSSINKLILRLIDAAIEDARDRGASSEELEDVMRKRGGIRKCFFHAVNCW